MSLKIKPYDYNNILPPLDDLPLEPPSPVYGERRYTVFIHLLNDGSHQARVIVETDELIRAYTDGHTAMINALDMHPDYVGYVRIWDNGRGCVHEQRLFYVKNERVVIHKIKEVER